jgi:hypothetical protein
VEVVYSQCGNIAQGVGKKSTCIAADGGGEHLFGTCKTVANYDPNRIPSDADFSNNYCLGYIEALTSALQKVHQYYAAVFQNLKYPIRDNETSKRYLATTVLLGHDICLTRNLNPKIIAMVFVKHGQQHPELLTRSSFEFADSALFETFNCAKPH